MTDQNDPTAPPSVEDVLASIRRMVTEEESLRRRTAPAPTGSLILTEDMRVDPDPPEPDKAEPEEAETGWDQQELAAFVRAVVREELQGELGERISANIRKLVRREISRALTTRMTE